MEPSRGCMTCDDIIFLMAKRIWACVVTCLESFGVLVSNKVNLDRCNSHKQKLFRVLSNI